MEDDNKISSGFNSCKYKYGPVRIPGTLSEPLYQFLKYDTKITGSLAFIINLSNFTERYFKSIEKPMFNLIEALGGDDEEKKNWESIITKGYGARKDLENYKQVLFRMVFCTEVDNYLAYLSDVMSLIFKTNPNTLKSGEQVSTEFILGFDSLEELVDALAEKRVDSLSYQGLDDLCNYFDERLGFKLFENIEYKSNAIRIIETRNLITHNRSVMNRKAIRKFPDFVEKPGEEIILNGDLLMENLLFLLSSAIDIDNRASQKFHIDRPLMKKDLN